MHMMDYVTVATLDKCVKTALNRTNSTQMFCKWNITPDVCVIRNFKYRQTNLDKLNIKVFVNCISRSGLASANDELRLDEMDIKTPERIFHALPGDQV